MTVKSLRTPWRSEILSNRADSFFYILVGVWSSLIKLSPYENRTGCSWWDTLMVSHKTTIFLFQIIRYIWWYQQRFSYIPCLVIVALVLKILKYNRTVHHIICKCTEIINLLSKIKTNQKNIITNNNNGDKTQLFTLFCKISKSFVCYIKLCSC
jgi:hypothetical protein